MKKKRFRIPIIGLICCMLLGTIAFAVNGRKITATYGGITIYLNGQKQEIWIVICSINTSMRSVHYQA